MATITTTASHRSGQKVTYQKTIDTEYNWDEFFPTDNIPIGHQRFSMAGEQMFPELVEADFANYGHLTQHTQHIATDIQNVLSHKGDAQITEAVLPQLIHMMMSSGQVSVNDEQLTLSVNILHVLAKHEVARTALVKSFELVPALISVLQTSASSAIQQKICTIFYILSSCSDGVVQIYRGQSISTLIKMLASSDQRIILCCHTILFRLVRQLGSSVSSTIRLAGGVVALTRVFVAQRENGVLEQKFCTLLAYSLTVIITGDSGSKEVFHRYGGTGELISIINSLIMSSSCYEKLLVQCMRLFVACTATTECMKDDIISNLGGLTAGYKVLCNTKDAQVKLSALYAIRNLSDRVDENMGECDSSMIGLIRDCVVLLSEEAKIRDPESSDTVCAAGILCNFTCNNTKYKQLIVENNWVDTIIQAFICGAERLSIAEPLICTLRHLTSRNTKSIDARDAIGRGEGLIKKIVSFLHVDRQSTTQEIIYIRSLLALIRNIGLSKVARKTMKKERVTKALCTLLEEVTDLDTTCSDIDPDEVIDECLGAMHILSRDENIRAIITSTSTSKGVSIIHLVSQHLASKRLNIQREAAGCLCELLDDEANGELVSKIKIKNPEFGTISLQEQFGLLLQSQSESIATYSASTLYKISGGEKFSNTRHEAVTSQKVVRDMRDYEGDSDV